MTIGSIFADAVSTAINGQARVFDYGDQATFVDLWTMGEEGCPRVFGMGEGSGREKKAAGNASGDPNQERSAKNGEPTAGKTIIIVWDGRALSQSDERAELLKPHLTPMDWVLAFSINALAQNEVPECADVAIHIIDLTGRDHTAWSMEMRHQLLAEMPWVTLHAPLIPNGPYRSGYRPVLDDYGSLLESNGNGTGWNLRAGTATLKACAFDGFGRNLAGLSGQWASTLVQTHDHHDLNNLVGHSILSGKEPSVSPLLVAFWNRLRWTGFLPGELPAPDVADINMGELDVLTIDDQLDVGWDHVICRLFGAENSEEEAEGRFESIGSNEKTKLYGSKSARTLLGSLKKKGAFEERCFDSPISCSEDKRPWLLVLDLLLFPGDPMAEHDWLRELLYIATGIPTDSSNLAWRGFSKDELDGVENWLRSGNVEDPAYNTALSLLPRLCALRWPSVPILLFSGTSRRPLTDKLVAYRNIFLAPQKPNLLSGNAAEESEAFLGGWRRELDSAMGLIAVQRNLLQLQRNGTTALASAHGTGDGGVSTGEYAAKQGAEAHQGIEEQNNNRQHRHLTIAFDESGNFTSHQHSAIGGVIIEARSADKNCARNLTSKFLETLRANGVNFYDHPPIYTEVRHEGGNYKVGRTRDQQNNCYGVIRKNHNISGQLRNVLGDKDYKSNIVISAFRCRIGRHLYQQGGPVDGTYLQWLGMSIELLLCEHLPSLGYEWNDKVSLAIWIPTRSVGTDDSKYGVNSQDLLAVGGGRTQTVGGYGGAYLIVMGALAGRLNTGKIIDNVEMKLRKIPYFDTTDQNRSYESALNWICPVCQTMKTPYLSRPRLIPVNINQPIMTEVGFEPRKQEYHLYLADGQRSGLIEGYHVTCNSCQREYMPADYSVAQHLADACMTATERFPSDELGCGNIERTVSFDVDAGQQLEDFLSAGRSFDKGHSFEGFSVCFRYHWFRDVLQARNELKAPVGARVVKECQKYANCISGDEITRLAAGYTGKRWLITLTGYCDEEAVVSTTNRIFDDCSVAKPQIMSGKTNRGKPSLSFQIGEAEKTAVLEPLKSALRELRAVINPNPL